MQGDYRRVQHDYSPQSELVENVDGVELTPSAYSTSKDVLSARQHFRTEEDEIPQPRHYQEANQFKRDPIRLEDQLMSEGGSSSANPMTSDQKRRQGTAGSHSDISDRNWDQRQATRQSDRQSQDRQFGAISQETKYLKSNNMPLATQSASQSSLIKQFSEKVKMQAERLQQMEAYKNLCERRICDFDPNHDFPVRTEHIGQQSEQFASATDFKRQLALKEQDLVYAKQRAEKAAKEAEMYKREAMELRVMLDQIEKANQAKTEQTQEASNEKSEQGLREQINQLEEEKNALLDYIEETGKQPDARVVQMSARIKQLEAENQNLYQMTENLKYQEAISRHKVEDLSHQVHSLSQHHSQLDLSQPRVYESTFGEAQTQEAFKQISITEELKQDQVEHMVLDLDALKRELLETQHQFNSTREVLEGERREKQELQRQLQATSARLIHIERIEGSRNLCIDKKITRADTIDTMYISELEEQRDRLLNENTQLQHKLEQQQHNVGTLQFTLNETQGELEGLINEHETLVNQLKEHQEQLIVMKEQPAKLRREAQEMTAKLEEKSKEVEALQDELRTVTLQQEMQTEMVRKLRVEKSTFENEIQALKTTEKEKFLSMTKHWEQTCEDLTKELNSVQSEMAEQEQMKKNLEHELFVLAGQVTDAQQLKQQQQKRIDALCSEVRVLQEAKETKDQKLRNQLQRNDEIQSQLDKTRSDLMKVKQEYELTQSSKNLEHHQLEHTINKVNKQAKLINKLCRDVSKVQELVGNISREFSLTPLLGAAEDKPTSDTDRSEKHGKQEPKITSTIDKSEKPQSLDDMLREANFFLKTIGEWLVSFAKLHKSTLKRYDSAQQEMQVFIQKVDSAETRCKQAEQDEMDARERESFMKQELDVIKEKLKQTQTEQKESYKREERIQRANQTAKTQVETLKKDVDRTNLQLKTILAEKERLRDDLTSKSELLDEANEHGKQMEMQISTLVAQKSQILELMERLQCAFPSQSLKEVFGQIVQSVHTSFIIEQEYLEAEAALLSNEGELRSFAKNEAEGLLSTKVIQLRKDVEAGRQQLRELDQKRQDQEALRKRLEVDLKSTESIERRRTDVALETEQNLTRVKTDLQKNKAELEFATRSKADLELALRATQEEKSMVERELFALRSQLQMKAQGSVFSIQSPMRMNLIQDELLSQRGPVSFVDAPQSTINQIRRRFPSQEPENNALFVNSRDSQDVTFLKPQRAGKPPAYSQSTRKISDQGLNSTRPTTQFVQSSPTVKYEAPVDHSQAVRAYQETLNKPLQQRSVSMINFPQPSTRQQSSLQSELKVAVTPQTTPLYVMSQPATPHITSYVQTTPGDPTHQSRASLTGSRHQKSHQASVQQKLSHLRNVFGAIRQNLQEESSIQTGDLRANESIMTDK